MNNHWKNNNLEGVMKQFREMSNIVSPSVIEAMKVVEANNSLFRLGAVNEALLKQSQINSSIAKVAIKALNTAEVELKDYKQIIQWMKYVHTKEVTA